MFSFFCQTYSCESLVRPCSKIDYFDNAIQFTQNCIEASNCLLTPFGWTCLASQDVVGEIPYYKSTEIIDCKSQCCPKCLHKRNCNPDGWSSGDDSTGTGDHENFM